MPRDYEKNPIVVTVTFDVLIYKNMSDKDIKDCLPVDESNFQEDMFNVLDSGFQDGDAGMTEIKLEIKR